MTDPRAVQILAAWFSPAYPIGAYSYSHGLEWAVESGDVADPAALEAWTADLLEFGAARTDAILLRHAHAAPDPVPLAELAAALAPSAERHLETTAQGAAFAKVTAAAWGLALGPAPYPVAVGRAARLLDLPADLTVTLFLQAFAANTVSAGVRLVPIGQTDGQRIAARLLPLAARIAAETEAATLDDLGGCAALADLAAMRHETQGTRLY
ncbi:MAG: urease accessory protein UreF, partial [Rhodobacteraceae bacterium]|nr:urease accessory protein UreF [Paracoccaceae bacterium]